MKTNKPVTFYLEPDLIASLRALAAGNGRTMVAEVRRALRRHIEAGGEALRKNPQES